MRIGLQLTHEQRVMLWRPLEPGVTVIGRNVEVDIAVPDERLAPVQCLLRRDGTTLVLENRSPDGTEVNGEPVLGQLKLAAGDCLTLGPMLACVVFEGAPPAEGEAGRTRTLAPQVIAAPARVYLTAPLTHPGRRWPLVEALTLGSDPTNDVVLDDPFVSAHHARLTWQGGRCLVRDLGSRNGVFVGEQKVVDGEVPLGAQLRLGRTTLVACAGEQPALVDAPRLVGDSDALEAVRQVIQRLAATSAPVLITGETGTGKEVVARLLAELSPRAAAPFVVLNCGSLTRTLIESELFGHERGAFTGATGRKAGAFEAAHGGTLFLDEIGELPLELQPQLLRVLESGEVRRVGTTEAFRVDVRVVAATNRNLAREVAAGRFRQDLFHRLHVLTVDLPPLRQRRADIPPLARHFACLFSPPGAPVELEAEALARLEGHDYPGNVRELRNVVQRAVLLRRGEKVSVGDISFPPSTLSSRVESESATSHRTLQEIEKAAIIAELRRFQGNKSEAATALGVSRSTIHRKIDEYGIDLQALT